MQPGIVPVVLIDFGGTGVNHADLVSCAAALTIQAQQHFALPPPYGYGVGATVRAGAGPFDVHPNEWVLGLFQHPDVDGALGYHDETATGRPFMKIFPLLDKQDGQPWQPTASHELLETLADPNISRGAQWTDGVFWAYEVCDPCEAQSYMINHVPVSDFVLPPWFEPISNTRSLKFNWMGNIHHAHGLLPGGYAQYFDAQQGWQQIFSQEKEPRSFRKNAKGRGFARKNPQEVKAAKEAKAAK